MLTAMSAVSMNSCFTGIESTPKISAVDVKKQNIVEKAEDSYLVEITPEPLKDWQKGKRFYVSDNKFGLLLQPSGRVADSLGGKEVRFEDIRDVTNINGEAVYEIDFLTSTGETITYRGNKSVEESREQESFKVPFLIDVKHIERLKSAMTGNTYYTVTSSWYDNDMKSFTGRKFVPVKVTNVKPGNAYYSTIVELSDENGKSFYLYMSVGNDIRSLRKFSSLFSLTDPRLKYPDISDSNWQNIINGKVAEDMTKEECRLALGSPANVDKRIGYSYIQEVWSYENGVYLVFEDNILRKFRQ